MVSNKALLVLDTGSNRALLCLQCFQCGSVEFTII